MSLYILKSPIINSVNGFSSTSSFSYSSGSKDIKYSYILPLTIIYNLFFSETYTIPDCREASSTSFKVLYMKPIFYSA